MLPGHENPLRGWRRPGGDACRRRGAFTLLEVLLSLAIIALLASVLVGGASNLLTAEPIAPEQVFWRSVQEARKTALRSGNEVRLRFDREKKQFLVIDGMAPATVGADGFTLEETPLKTFPVHPSLARELTVEFLGAVKGGNMILVGGVLIEAQPIPYVKFYPDGTCMAFRTQFTRPGSAEVVSIDPWTCSPVLPPTDPNARSSR